VSGLFGALDISASGINAAQTWINTAAGNIANANDVVPTSEGAYQEQRPIFMPETSATGEGEGVAVPAVSLGDSAGALVYDPGSPMADKQGLVRETDVDISRQLVDLVSAQSEYQANTAAIQRAQSAYQSALTLGT
jgi:flagellar basal-body rod protein FlgC